jgi:hypothetical protein
MGEGEPICQCLFFAPGRIDYWENIKSDSDTAIEVLLRQRLSTENWEAAEAWTQDKLICRILGPADRAENTAAKQSSPGCGN